MPTMNQIPLDTLAAHTSEGLRFYTPPKFRGRGAPVKAGSAALAFAVLTSRNPEITPEDRIKAAKTLVSLKVRFAARLAGHMLNLDSHEGIIGSDDHALSNLCDTRSTWRPVRGEPETVFQLDKRTKRVETWSYTSSISGARIAVVTIDEQRA